MAKPLQMHSDLVGFKKYLDANCGAYSITHISRSVDDIGPRLCQSPARNGRMRKLFWRALELCQDRRMQSGRVTHLAIRMHDVYTYLRIRCQERLLTNNLPPLHDGSIILI